jgi:tetratricopeptide (TPR) repeat protein
MADNIAYPGNPGLPKEVREKILSTFRHSLNLYKAGKGEDCAVGCEFILKMDPRFVPARRLLDKARDPGASTDIAELESYVAETLTPMEKLGSTAPDKLLISAIEAYADRDFDRAIENSNRVLSVLPGNKDAREILEKATRKKELQPHVDNFRQRALFALESGQKDEAKRNFERMRSLDPEHPEVERLADRLRDDASASPAGAPAPQSPADVGANPFDFPFGDFEAPSAETDARESPAATMQNAVFDAPPPPPPPPAPAPSPIALDSLSLDVPETPDWSPIPEPDDAAAAAPVPPASDSASSFAGMWANATSPEISLGAPSGSIPSPAAQTPDVSPEIQKLLDQGDRLSEKGDHQGAIEIWSRIFLSDLSNPEAATRIENARTRLAETNRRVSEALKQGRALYESGQPKDAREKFLEVLAIDENEATARAYLHRIEDDLSRPPASYDLAATTPAGDVLAEEDEPGGAPALPAESPSRPPTRRKPSSRRVSGVLVAGLLAAIGAALFLMLRPRASAPPPSPASAAAPGNAIGEATRLFQAGKVDEARQALLAIPASSPQYARARKMLATFGPAAAPSPGEAAATASSPAAPPAAPPPSAEAQRKEAETALAEHRYIAALSGFHQSAPGYPGDAELKKEMAEATVKVQEISPAVRLFNDGDYDSSLPILWRLYQADHQNYDVKSYLVRCYYNQGVIALQNNLFDKAAKAFGDALGVQPDDALSRRQKAFAERYVKKPPDLLARVYLKYLRPRP